MSIPQLIQPPSQPQIQQARQEFYENFIKGVANNISEGPKNVTYLNYKDNNMEKQNKNFKRLIVGIGLNEKYLDKKSPYINITNNMNGLNNELKNEFYDDSYQILFILKKMLNITELNNIYQSYFELYGKVNDEKKF